MCLLAVAQAQANSFLNALMSEIPETERILPVLKDSQELPIHNRNKTQLAIPKEANEIL